jgi:hypothetical protein
LIIYRKASALRIQRMPVPEPPYWAATMVAPYSARRGSPVSIDYLELRASYSDRLEVGVCEDVVQELQRASERHPIAEPALIEASEFAEAVFRRGEEALRFFCRNDQAPIHLISTRGALPHSGCDRAVIVIAAWPLDFPRLAELFQEARDRGFRWGVAVPVMFPVTTDLGALQDLVASAHGAQFLAALPVEVDATARNAIAQSLTLDDDRETYEMLFHADLEPIHVATERHIAALAAEIGAADFITPPGLEERSNWNAALLLTLTATRMIAMKHEVETASRIARSARAVAQLDKPLERIASAARLAIVESLDPISVEALTHWLESGSAPFFDDINKMWRLRRDAGMA